MLHRPVYKRFTTREGSSLQNHTKSAWRSNRKTSFSNTGYARTNCQHFPQLTDTNGTGHRNTSTQLNAWTVWFKYSLESAEISYLRLYHPTSFRAIYSHSPDPTVPWQTACKGEVRDVPYTRTWKHQALRLQFRAQRQLRCLKWRQRDIYEGQHEATG